MLNPFSKRDQQDSHNKSFFTRMSPPASTKTVCNMVTYSVSIQSMANLSTIMIPPTQFISMAL